MHINYATLDVYALFTMHNKYMQAPVRDDTHLCLTTPAEDDECADQQVKVPDRTRTIHRASLSRETTVVTFWKREIDKFAKDMTLPQLLLPGTFTSDQRKELHDYADIPSLSSVRGSCILQTHSYLAVYASDNYYLRSST